MILIERYEKESETVLTVNGHADFAPKGRDIVCAGISALCMAFTEWLCRLEKRGYIRGLDIELGDGYLRCAFTDDADSRGREALSLILCGMELIAAQNPENAAVLTWAGTGTAFGITERMAYGKKLLSGK